MRGEDLLREAFALGFRRLFLATGYAREAITGLEGIAEIVGKDPPF